MDELTQREQLQILVWRANPQRKLTLRDVECIVNLSAFFGYSWLVVKGDGSCISGTAMTERSAVACALHNAGIFPQGEKL